MASQPATPSVSLASQPARTSSASLGATLAGNIFNYANSQSVLAANQRTQDNYQQQLNYQRQQQSQGQQRPQGQSQQAYNPIEIMKQQAQQLQARQQLFQLGAQLKAAQIQQEGKEADFALAEPLAQLGSYAGTQNWGSFYAQRKAIVSNPLYTKTKEVRSRLEAMDNMIGQWGEAYNSKGEARNFLEISKEADSPDWATRKEALRILALKSENPTQFLMNFPGLSAMQVGELTTFVRANPMVTDRTKIAQYRQFEETFNKKLLENSGNDYQLYLQQLASPEVVQQKEDARRAILYGKGSDNVTAVASDDRMLDQDTLNQLENYLRGEVADSAGMLSLTRWAGEGGRLVRSLFDKDYQALTDDEMDKVSSPVAIDRVFSDKGFVDTVAQEVMKAGAFSIGSLVDDVPRALAALEAEASAASTQAAFQAASGSAEALKRSTSLKSATEWLRSGNKITAELKALEKAAASAAKQAAANPTAANKKIALATARALQGGISNTLTKMHSAAKLVGKSPKWLFDNSIMGQTGKVLKAAYTKVAKKTATTTVAKATSEKVANTVAKKAGARVAGKVVGSAVGLGLDAMFYYQDAGRDNAQLSDNFKILTAAQKSLQASASTGTPPAQLNKIMSSLMTAIENINTIASRHNINVQLDINNIVSKQMATKMRAKSAIDSSMATVYGTPQPGVDPRSYLMPQVQQTPLAEMVQPQGVQAKQQLSFDDIAPKQ